MLVVLADIDDSLLDEPLEPALLEYTSVRGVIRMRGEATFEQPSLVRFHAQGDAEVIQRRAFVRVHSPQEVELSDPPQDGALRAHTVDLSGGGMLLTGAEQLRRRRLGALRDAVGRRRRRRSTGSPAWSASARTASGR